MTNDPENATDLPDVKAKTAQRVVVKAKTGFVERLQVKQVIVKSKSYNINGKVMSTPVYH